MSWFRSFDLPPATDEGLALIGAGFGRTATATLYMALNELGVPCYHMKENILNSMKGREDMKVWIAALERGYLTRTEADYLFKSRYNAAVDFPASALYPSLMELYPDAKVVLTVRDASAWVDSAVDTINWIESQQFRSLLGAYCAWFHMMFGTFLSDMLRIGRGVWGCILLPQFEPFPLLEHDGPGKQRGIVSFEAWLAGVKRRVPKAKLLVFNAKHHGWSELCAFLGKPLPKGVKAGDKLPRVNDTAEFTQAIRPVIFAYFAIPLVSTALGVGLAAFAVRRWLLK